MTDKTEIRKRLRAQRKQLTAEYRASAANKIAATVSTLNSFKNSTKISFYQPIQSELDSVPLIQQAWQAKKSCYLPIVDFTAGLLHFAPYNADTKLIKNRYGILEPEVVTEELIEATELELVITPLVGFDAKRYRLGNGGGFYDRSFSFKQLKPHSRPFLLGIGFAVQETTELQPMPWDIQLDLIVTEKTS